MQFALGQFSFGHFKNIVACLEIIWFSRHWLFCSATSCKAMLLTLGCFGQGPQLLLLGLLLQRLLRPWSNESGSEKQMGTSRSKVAGAFLAWPSRSMDLQESPWRIGQKFSWTQWKFCFIWCEHNQWLAGGELQPFWLWVLQALSSRCLVKAPDRAIGQRVPMSVHTKSCFTKLYSILFVLWVSSAYMLLVFLFGHSFLLSYF